MRYLTISAAAVLAALAVAWPAGASLRPSIAFVSSSPLQVRGVHFAGRERVHLTFAAKTTTVLTIRTTRAGTFLVNAPTGFALDQCGGGSITVSAAGVHGDAALLRRPSRLCAPAAPATPAYTP
jgi:hypothetical protein